MKKQKQSKPLLVSVDKLRDLTPTELATAAGGCRNNSDPCPNTRTA